MWVVLLHPVCGSFRTAVPTNDYSICEPSITAYWRPIHYINGPISLATSSQRVSNTNCWFVYCFRLALLEASWNTGLVSSSTGLAVCRVCSVCKLDSLEVSEGRWCKKSATVSVRGNGPGKLQTFTFLSFSFLVSFDQCLCMRACMRAYVYVHAVILQAPCFVVFFFACSILFYF